MKQCAHCKEFKPLDQFAWNNKLLGTRQKHCRKCMKKFNQESYGRRSQDKKEQVREDRKRKYDEARQYIWDYLSTHPCAKCGQSNPIVLEFHHVKGRKEINIANMPRNGNSLESIRKEIGKCVVLCANCHRIETHQERGWFQG